MSVNNHNADSTLSQGAIEVIRFDAPVHYIDAYCAQIERRDAVLDGNASEALFMLEHLPVITLGREAKPKHILADRETLHNMGIDIHEADRGGDVTYHGPGQLVAYPVLNLKARNMAIRTYLRAVEDVVIDTLAEYGLEGKRVYGFTGVWVNHAKVAAIGVGARRWVTFHGLALNVDPNMKHFAQIVPCGIADKPITSLRTLLGEAPSIADVSARLERHFLERFV
jgi:lipoate-protein ligase B